MPAHRFPVRLVLVGASIALALATATVSTAVTRNGTSKADRLTGTPGPDRLFGRGGADVLRGLGGRDLLDGGVAGDRLDGGPGADRLLGGKGHDRIVGGGGADSADGGNGNDRVDVGAGNDNVFGGTGGDRILGRAGNDALDGHARCARLRPRRRSGRLPHRDEVRQCADQGWHHGPSRNRAIPGRRQDLPGRLLRRQVGAGVPAARARHVRAAGSSRRYSVSRRRADAAIRQRGMDACVSDGRAVRSHPRRARRTVRKGVGPAEAAGGKVAEAASAVGIPAQPPGQRRGRSRPIVCSKAGKTCTGFAMRLRPAASRTPPARSSFLQGVYRGAGAEARGRPRTRVSGDGGQAGRRGISAQAGTHRPVGSLRRFDAFGLDALDLRTGPSSPSRSCTRRRSMPAISMPSSTCSCSSTAASRSVTAVTAVSAVAAAVEAVRPIRFQPSSAAGSAT